MKMRRQGLLHIAHTYSKKMIASQMMSDNCNFIPKSNLPFWQSSLPPSSPIYDRLTKQIHAPPSDNLIFWIYTQYPRERDNLLSFLLVYWYHHRGGGCFRNSLIGKKWASSSSSHDSPTFEDTCLDNAGQRCDGQIPGRRRLQEQDERDGSLKDMGGGGGCEHVLKKGFGGNGRGCGLKAKGQDRQWRWCEERE